MSIVVLRRALSSRCAPWISPPAVLLTTTAYLFCVGAAVADTALALCAMFTAHAPRDCVGAAAINRTWVLAAAAVLPTKPTFLLCVGAAVADTALAVCAVLPTKATFISCVGAAVADTALAFCAMLYAQTSRL